MPFAVHPAFKREAFPLIRPDSPREQMSIHDSRLAPVALFVYNRPEHTRKTVESLQANHLAHQTDLFIFADGAKNGAGGAAIAEVRTFLRTIDGFKSVTITERERNWGLSRSIVDGVTQLCGQYGRAVVVEDDISTAPDFLTFLNFALDQYEDRPKVFTIGGFNLPISIPRHYPHDAFFSHRFMCWGWGTWRNRWELADWSVKDYPQFAASRERQKRFDRGGNDCSYLLSRHVSGRIDSWDSVFNYTHFQHDAVALLPVISKTYNIGLDGSGTHCRRAPFEQSALRREDRSDSYRLPDRLEPDPQISASFRRRCDRSLAKRVAHYVRDTLTPRRNLALLENCVPSEQAEIKPQDP